MKYDEEGIANHSKELWENTIEFDLCFSEGLSIEEEVCEKDSNSKEYAHAGGDQDELPAPCFEHLPPHLLLYDLFINIIVGIKLI